MNAICTTFQKAHLKIARVVDGDGLIATNLFNNKEEEIRLLGIDAPELKKCRKLIQDEKVTHLAGEFLMHLGKLSYQYLIKIASIDEPITLVMEQDNHTDLYGRTLAYVYLNNGRCLNEILIKEGYAKPFDKYYCNKLAEYQVLHVKAKIERKGLYSITKTF